MSPAAAVARLAEKADQALGPSVLLVEDSPGEASIVRAALRHAGVTDVTWVVTVTGAIAALATRTFACVVLDLGLPDLEGLETLDAALEAAGATPVIVVTGRDDPGLAMQAMRRGADDYVLKSEIDTRLLERAISYSIERAQARAALKKRETQFRTIVEALGEGLVVQDGSGRIEFANEAACRILGLCLDEVTGRTSTHEPWRSIREDGSPFPAEQHPAMVALRLGRDVMGVVMGVDKPDGTLTWIEINSRPLLTPAGRPYAVVTSFRDVTDRRRVEEATRFQAKLLDAVGEAVFAADLNATVTYWGPAAERLFGWKAEEAVGRGLFDLAIAPLDEVDRARAMESLTSRETWTAVLELTRRDGSTLLAEVTNTPVFDEAGRHVGLIGIASDVTEREAAEAALEDSERQLAEAQALAHVGSWEWDVVRDEVRWSAELYRIFGQDPAVFQPSYSSFLGCILEDDREAVEELVGPSVGRGESIRFLYRIVRPDGEVRWIDTAGRAATHGPDGPRLYVGSAFDVTERLVAERRLRESEERYRTIVETAQEGVWITDAGGVTTFVNRRMAELLGRSVNEMLGSHVFDHMDDEGIAIWERNLRARTQGRCEHLDYKLVREDGSELWTAMSTSPHFDARANNEGTLAMVTDVTERHHAEAALRLSEARLAQAQRVARLGSWSLDRASHTMTWSDEQYRLFGYRPGEIEPSERAMLARLHPDDVTPIRVVIHADRLHAAAWEGEARVTPSDGTTRWLGVRIEPVHDSRGGVVGFSGTTQDITERKRVELELSHLALHDPLTGLPNRTLLRDRLHHALSQTERDGGLVAVLFLDIDRFKFVNDSRGHPAGDALLKGVASRIQETVRPVDTVGRFGGDEFVVVCEGVSDPSEAEVIGHRLTRSFDRPFSVEGEEFFASASVGVALGTVGDAPDGLLSAADAAMYRAKSRGPGQTALFDTSLRDRAEFNVVGEVALHRALSSGQLDVVYQPVVSLESGAVVGAEALVRWNHPDQGVLTAGEFVPLAEETGLIVPLGAFVLARACQDLANWRDVQPDLYVAVNVSARQLMVPDFAPMLAEMLATDGVDPGKVVLEVTETVLMDEAEFFLGVLDDLKAQGVKIAIDDFGTGYSSLNYLRLFPLDILKVDRRFVEGVADSPQDASIVTAVLRIAEALGIATVAEGVETEAQLRRLRDLGCAYGQGYHFARPIPAADLTALLRARALGIDAA